MGNYSILAPGIAIMTYVIGAFFLYSLRCVLGKSPRVDEVERRSASHIIGRFIHVFWLWLLSPLERLVIGGLVTPNTITGLALGACVGSALAIAFGFLATGAWLYVVSGTLDILDGRVARATGQTSLAGGFLDSIADRWGEMAVFAGWAWYLRGSSWSFATIAALGGSMMVSYVRAAGEARNILLVGGLMQRPERILTVSVGTLICSFMLVHEQMAAQIPTVMGVLLSAVAFGSVVTAIGRWRAGFSRLNAVALSGATAKSQEKRIVGSMVPPSSTPLASAAHFTDDKSEVPQNHLPAQYLEPRSNYRVDPLS